MKVCVLQPLFPKTPAQSPQFIDWLFQELDRCDNTVDLIVLPEYCNAPSVYPEPSVYLSDVETYTVPLLEKVRDTCRRCRAFIAVNLAHSYNGVLRNTTLLFDRQGRESGAYFKQQLFPTEPQKKLVDTSYTLKEREPTMVDLEGIRFGFLTCYDFYFPEMLAFMAKRQPDIVIGCSHQRGERQDVLEILGRSCALTCNAYLVRSSVSMGEESLLGGCSMVAAPDGTILGDMKSRVGSQVFEIDPKWKYVRSNGYGAAAIRHDLYVEAGRTPWAYRPAGPGVVPGDSRLPYPRVCAHRGLHGPLPENSLPAFGAAVALGAPEIEFDLYPTADGELVVCHDDQVDRVSDGTGRIQDMTWEEIQKLDIGSRVSPLLRGLRMPRFEDVLRQFARRTVFNIHIKSEWEEEEDDGVRCYNPATFQKIVRLLDAYDCRDHAYIAGRPSVLRTALNVAPDIPRCCGAGGGDPAKIVDRAIQYRCQKLQFYKTACTQEMIDRAHRHGMRCNLFWADDPQEALAYLDRGIDTVLTNAYSLVSSAVAAHKPT